jgi:hypothetical protein
VRVTVAIEESYQAFGVLVRLAPQSRLGPPESGRQGDVKEAGYAADGLVQVLGQVLVHDLVGPSASLLLGRRTKPKSFMASLLTPPDTR